MLPYLIAGAIGFGIAKLFEDDKLSKYADGGLIAPNGKPSNLTPEQYKLVRTPAFKQWFGDWENDPENSSKVVDSNGEPLVVYHGTKNRFNTFKYGKFGFGFFSPTYKIARAFSSVKGQILEVFLSIKNPKIYTSNDKEYFNDPYQIFRSDVYSIEGYDTKYANKYGIAEWYLDEPIDTPKRYILKLKNEDYNGVIIKDTKADSYYGDNELNTQIFAFEPNQIKLADGTNTTFDGNNPDIRFNGGGEVNKKLILDL